MKLKKKTADDVALVLEYPFINITLRSTLAKMVVPARVPSMVQIELFNHLLRIIIIWNKSYSCVQIVHIREEYLINKIPNVK